MTLVKRLSILVILALSLSCAGLTNLVTSGPQYGPETVLSTLSSIQDSAISKEASKDIPTSSARIIITFVVDSAKVVKTVTNEATYKGLIDTSLAQVRTDLPVVDEAKFTASFDFLHKVLTQR